MNVNGVPSQASIAIQTHKKAHSVTEEIPVESEEPQDVEGTETENEAKGVIRLLQAGHFKGVADVRLRISHFEELQALEDQNLKDSAAEGFDGLNQTIQDQITPLIDSGELSEDQMTALENFLSELQTEQGDFLGTDGGSLQELIASWQEKLQGLMDLLNPPAPTEEPVVEQTAAPEPQVDEQQPPAEILTEEPTEQTPEITEQTPALEPQVADEQSPEEVPAEGPAEEVTEETEPQASVQEVLTETEPVAEETEPVEESNPFEGFQQSILDALEAFLSNLDESSSSLPPLSEPTGNGKAYAKFLEIYESMQAGGTTDPSESELLDVEETIAPEEAEVLS